MPAPGREESLRECKVLIVLQTVGSMRSLPICIAGNNFFPPQAKEQRACMSHGHHGDFMEMVKPRDTDV